MKKRLLIIALLLVVVYPFTVKASFGRQQAFSGTNTTFASSVTTSSVTVTAGNLIVCAAEADTVAANGITMTDSKGNSWTRLKSTALAATFDHEIWWAKATTGGSGYTVTATDTGGGVDSLIICEEWSGQDTVTPNDKSAGATDSSGTSSALDSGNTSATSQANELIVGSGAVSVSADTLTLGSGFSNKTQVNTAFSTLGFETKTVSSTGTYNATFSAGTAGSWAMQVGTFIDATQGGGVVLHAKSTQSGGLFTQSGGRVIIQ